MSNDCLLCLLCFPGNKCYRILKYHSGLVCVPLQSAYKLNPLNKGLFYILHPFCTQPPSGHSLFLCNLQIHLMALKCCPHLSHIYLSIPNAAVEVSNQFVLVGNFDISPTFNCFQHMFCFLTASFRAATGQHQGKRRRNAKYQLTGTAVLGKTQPDSHCHVA